MKKSYVYWLKTPDMRDITTEGYVGVSCDPAKRFKGHQLSARKGIPRPEMAEQLLAGNVTCEIVLEADRDTCSDKELELRPDRGIGWNRARGGCSGSEHLFTFGREYYSDKLGIWKTCSGWSDYSGVDASKIRRFLTRREGATIDQILGYSKPPKSRSGNPLILENPEIENVILYYLENTSMTRKKIKKILGIRADLEGILRHKNLPKWIFTHCEVYLSDSCKIRVKRQFVIYDLDAIANIYFMAFYEGVTAAEMSRRTGYKPFAIRSLVRQMEGL